MEANAYSDSHSRPPPHSAAKPVKRRNHTPSPFSRRLQADRIAALYQQEPNAIMGHLLANYLAAGFLAQVFDAWMMTAWAGAMTVACGLRAGFAWFFDNRGERDPNQADLLRHGIGTFACTLTWSVGALALMPQASVPIRTFLMMILAGITAAGVVTLSAHLKSFLAFSCGMLLLPSLWLCSSPVLLDNAMAGVALVYFIFCLSSARRAGKILSTSFEYRYRHEDVSRARQQFLSNMSHEIRTPMNGVLGMAELVLRSPLTAEQKDWMSTLHRSGKELLTLLDDVLDLSKMEAGRTQLRPESFDPIPLLDDVGKLHAASATKKGVGFCVDVPLDLPQSFLGDAKRIRQVLHNLVGNAVKFTSTGQVVLRARMQVHQGTSALLLEVEDDGIGIDKSRQKAIFEDFTQADGSTTRRFGGTGLGLSICQRLVESMQGTIEVESELTKGSLFRVRLPLPIHQGARKLEPLGTTVLLMDEDQNSKRLIARIQRPGMVIHQLRHAEGFEKLAQHFQKETGPKRLILSPGKIKDSRVLQRIAEVATQQFWQVWECTSALQEKTKHESFRSLSAPWSTWALGSVFYPDAFASRRQPSASNIPRLNILVADDHAVNRKLAKRMLEQLGQKVRTAMNGEELLELFQEEPADFIFMDVQMPLLDGIEATQRLRGLPGGADVTVLALTAQALEEERQRCLTAGMDGVMTKPLGFRKLEQVLKNAKRAKKRVI